MNVQLNSVSDTRKSLVVTLDPSEVDTEHQAVVAEFAKQARIPGFRPGKAPAAMIVKRFGKDIAEEFKQKVVAKAYRSALEKEKLEVLNVVNVAPPAAAFTMEFRAAPWADIIEWYAKTILKAGFQLVRSNCPVRS